MGSDVMKKPRRAFTPPGWPRVIPRIVAVDSERLVRFIKQVFDAKGRYQSAAPTELRIGGSVILVSEAEQRQPTTACLYVYVQNADATYRRALRAGARSVEEPTLTPYGDRRGMVEDAWGNTWQIATRTKPHMSK